MPRQKFDAMLATCGHRKLAGLGPRNDGDRAIERNSDAVSSSSSLTIERGDESHSSRHDRRATLSRRSTACEPNATRLFWRIRIRCRRYRIIADFVGDSLGLSRQAAKTEADVIVFCGVHFMAETAAILCPDKTVLIPDLEAGCSLASSITADQLREWKAEHPGAVVVSYVNTSAEVKAESDYCCTSANAVEIVRSIPADQEILFLPDLFLGEFVRRETGRANIHLWMGECHVHAGIMAEDVERARRARSGSRATGASRVRLWLALSARYPVWPARCTPHARPLHRRYGSARHESLRLGPIPRRDRDRSLAPACKLWRPERHSNRCARFAVCGYMKMITLEKLTTR